MNNSNNRKDTELRITKMRENEITEVSSVLAEAALWLNSIGREMWQENQYSVSGILNTYKPDDIYVGYLDGKIVATMILQEEDTLLWPEANIEQSLFLHKLAVKRQYAKIGLSAEMIDWAKGFARTLDKCYLRLDCAADRPKLCDFYERYGFIKVREQLILNEYPTAFYECKLL